MSLGMHDLNDQSCLFIHGLVSFFTENLGMISCVEAFLVHHAAVGDKVLPDHLNFGDESISNFIGDDIANEKQIHQKLIELFSHEHDWILDVNSSKGKGTKTKEKIINTYLLL
jgi:hypothetical protein